MVHRFFMYSFYIYLSYLKVVGSFSCYDIIINNQNTRTCNNPARKTDLNFKQSLAVLYYKKTINS